MAKGVSLSSDFFRTRSKVLNFAKKYFRGWVVASSCGRCCDSQRSWEWTRDAWISIRGYFSADIRKYYEKSTFALLLLVLQGSSKAAPVYKTCMPTLRMFRIAIASSSQWGNGKHIISNVVEGVDIEPTMYRGSNRKFSPILLLLVLPETVVGGLFSVAMHAIWPRVTCGRV